MLTIRPRSYFVPCPDGSFKRIDAATGQCIAHITNRGVAGLQWPMARQPVRRDIKKFCKRVELSGGEIVWLDPFTTAEEVKLLTATWDRYLGYVEAAIQGLYEGQTITKTCQRLGISVGQFRHWKKVCPSDETQHEIERALLDARVAFGDACAEQALEIADDSTSATVMSDNLRVNTRRWLAKCNHSDVYGDKVKHQGDAQAPIAFTIVTGVPQPEQIEQPEKPRLPDIPIDAADRPDEVSSEA